MRECTLKFVMSWNVLFPRSQLTALLFCSGLRGTHAVLAGSTYNCTPEITTHPRVCTADRAAIYQPAEGSQGGNLCPVMVVNEAWGGAVTSRLAGTWELRGARRVRARTARPRVMNREDGPDTGSATANGVLLMQNETWGTGKGQQTEAEMMTKPQVATRRAALIKVAPARPCQSRTRRIFILIRGG